MEQDAIGGSHEKERNKPPGLWTGAGCDKYKYNKDLGRAARQEEREKRWC